MNKSANFASKVNNSSTIFFHWNTVHISIVIMQPNNESQIFSTTYSLFNLGQRTCKSFIFRCKSNKPREQEIILSKSNKPTTFLSVIHRHCSYLIINRSLTLIINRQSTWSKCVKLSFWLINRSNGNASVWDVVKFYSLSLYKELILYL